MRTSFLETGLIILILVVVVFVGGLFVFNAFADALDAQFQQLEDTMNESGLDVNFDSIKDVDEWNDNGQDLDLWNEDEKEDKKWFDIF